MPPIKPYSTKSLTLKDLISLYSDHLTESDICLLNNPPYVLTIPLDTLLPNSKHRATYIPPRPQNPWILFRKDFEARYRKHAPTISARNISSLASETWRNGERDLVRFFRILAKITAVRHQMIYPEYKFTPKKPGKEKTWIFKQDARSIKFENTRKKESVIDSVKGDKASERLRMNKEEKVGMEERTIIESHKVNLPVENKYNHESHEAKESNAEAAFLAHSSFPTTQSDFLLPTPVLDPSFYPCSSYSPVTPFSQQGSFGDGNLISLLSPDLSEICNSDLMKNGFPIDDSNEEGVWNCAGCDDIVQYPLSSMPLSSSLYPPQMEHFDFSLYHQPPEVACVIDSSLSYPYSPAHLSAPPPGIRLDLCQLQQQRFEKQVDLHLDCFKQQ
ncbi:8338_t:CDS:2 [Paraglomus brasilianum]|uniref:8338_t:CDS:1 n=1 Tax=Paraglomus brasilianum TaxID=144538 RepID=A0A9N9CPL4_9GLOM|nr:8338_t:CDS:2 [Paraglomus brasilianum]